MFDVARGQALRHRTSLRFVFVILFLLLFLRFNNAHDIQFVVCHGMFVAFALPVGVPATCCVDIDCLRRSMLRRWSSMLCRETE